MAIWWHVHQHYRSIVDADLILAPHEVSASRLACNDVNLLLGWDAVSAHLEEHATREGDASVFKAGHGESMRELLNAPSSRVWPPAELQELCNNKAEYLRLAEAHGITVAPTAIFDCKQATALSFADFAVAAARNRAWRRFVAKPSPSSWSRGVECFVVDESNLDKLRAELAVYFDSSGHASRHIVLQRYLTGLETEPETRCFFFGYNFLYAVANSRFVDDRLEVEDCPEAASTSPVGSSRALSPEYWHPHMRLGERLVRDLMPRLHALDGATPLDGFPWVVRFDFGLHPSADLVNAQRSEDDSRPAVFLNEIEIVPTLYLNAKFGHDHDFIAEYAAKFVKTAALVTGIHCLELDYFHASDSDDNDKCVACDSHPDASR